MGVLSGGRGITRIMLLALLDAISCMKIALKIKFDLIFSIANLVGA